MDNMQIKHYNIIQEIGSGGMAAVYKAVDTKLERVVAIKVLHSHYLKNQNIIKRFEKEAKSVASMKHNNIIHLYDYGVVSDQYFYVMEFVEGNTLSDLINKKETISPEAAAIICLGVCDALNYAHNKNVIHRDITPSNIIIDNSGSVKLADFGIAKFLFEQDLTSHDSVLGTPTSLAPEQLQKGKLGPYTDYYALGVMLYKMLSGAFPFCGRNLEETMFQITQGKYEPLDSISNSVPPDMIAIVNRCLKKETGQRYQTAEELIQDLNSFLEVRSIVPSERAVMLFISDEPAFVRDVVGKSVRSLLERVRFQVSAKNWQPALKLLEIILYMDPDNSEALEFSIRLQKHKKKKKTPTTQIKISDMERGRTFKKSMFFTAALLILVLGAILPVAYWYKTRKPEAPAPPVPEYKAPVQPQPVDTVKDTARPEITEPEVKEPVKPVPKVRPRPKITRKITPKPRIDSVKANALPDKDDKKDSVKAADSIKAVKALAPSCLGYLFIYSEPYSSVFIDGIETGMAPFGRPISIPCGRHALKLVNKSCKPYVHEIKINPGDTLRLQVFLKRK
jgi:serine/threonine-protein kinase